MLVEIKNIDFLPELRFKTSRSAGKGGQNVNKVETKVSLYFNILESNLLTDEEKELLFTRLKHKINQNGDLRLSFDRERSQLRNKQKLIEKFYELLIENLKTNKKRIPSKKPKAVDRKRLENKKRRSEIKNSRKKII